MPGDLFFDEKLLDSGEITGEPGNPVGDFFATDGNVALEEWLVNLAVKQIMEFLCIFGSTDAARSIAG